MPTQSSNNYYALLQVRQAATAEEIKRSYRRLAMKYHPDKNPDDQLAEMIFRDIAAAYDTLSDPAKRKAYDQTHYNSEGYRQKEITAMDLLAESIQVKKIVDRSDHFRLNGGALFFTLSQLLGNENLYVLERTKDEAIKLQLVENILSCSALLKLSDAMIIAGALKQVAGSDANTHEKITLFLKQHTKRHRWEKYKVLVAVLAAILLSIIIYLVK